MESNINNYKMIYHYQHLNIIDIKPTIDTSIDLDINGFKKVKFIDVSAIDENGRFVFIHDEVSNFSFVQK